MKVIQATHLADVQNLERSAVRGQYSAGWMKETSARVSRRAGVNPNSTTPTYVAMKFLIDNWRWQGVPFCVPAKRPEKKCRRLLSSFAKFLI